MLKTYFLIVIFVKTNNNNYAYHLSLIIYLHFPNENTEYHGLIIQAKNFW